MNNMKQECIGKVTMNASVIENFERIRSRIMDANQRICDLRGRLDHVLRDPSPSMIAGTEAQKSISVGSSFARDLRVESDCLDSLVCTIQDILDRLDV